MTWFAALWHLAGLLTGVAPAGLLTGVGPAGLLTGVGPAGLLTGVGPAGLLAGTAAVAGLLWVTAIVVRTLLRRPGRLPHPGGTPRDLRERLTLSGLVRQRDPDAAGRSRPRAPGVAPATG